MSTVMTKTSITIIAREINENLDFNRPAIWERQAFEFFHVYFNFNLMIVHVNNNIMLSQTKGKFEKIEVNANTETSQSMSGKNVASVNSGKYIVNVE